MSLKDLFTVSTIRPGIGDRVRHKETRRIGTVVGKAKIRTRGVGGFNVNMLTVDYDDGSTGMMVAENEFIKLDRKTPKQTLRLASPKPTQPATGPINVPEYKGRRYSSAFGAEVDRDV